MKMRRSRSMLDHRSCVMNGLRRLAAHERTPVLVEQQQPADEQELASKRCAEARAPPPAAHRCSGRFRHHRACSHVAGRRKPAACRSLGAVYCRSRAVSDAALLRPRRAPRVDHEPVALDARERSIGEIGAEEADVTRRRSLIEAGDEPFDFGQIGHLDRPAVELGVPVDEVEVDRRARGARTAGRVAGRPPSGSPASSPARARRRGTSSRSR